MEKFFKVKERNSTVRTEIIAGITTFFATAYIVLVNPDVISGGDQSIFNGVLFATCIGACIGTLLMAFIANIPFAQAPGMGLNAFFAFTAMPTIAALLGDPNLPLVERYQMALPLVFLSGVIFIVISLVGWREKIINGIPKNIKLSLCGGIGLFIAYLGLQNAGIIVPNQATQVSLIRFSEFTTNGHAIHGAVLTLVGLFIIAALYAKHIKGGILIGIVATTVLAFVTGFTKMPDDFTFNLGQQASDFFHVSFLKLDFLGPFRNGNTLAVLGSLTALMLSFAMVNMFDSMGTIFGAARAAGMVNDKGETEGLNKGLLSDAMGTAIGALLGTSTVTTVVESQAGIGEGGRTGLTSLVTGILFLVALLLAPFMVLIPSVATAPALIFVGCLMMSSLKEIDFDDASEALPAFLTIIMMPLTYSIANGIAFGLISYVAIKLLIGKWREIKLPTAIVSLLFILQFIL